MADYDRKAPGADGGCGSDAGPEPSLLDRVCAPVRAVARFRGRRALARVTDAVPCGAHPMHSMRNQVGCLRSKRVSLFLVGSLADGGLTGPALVRT